MGTGPDGTQARGLQLGGLSGSRGSLLLIGGSDPHSRCCAAGMLLCTGSPRRAPRRPDLRRHAGRTRPPQPRVGRARSANDPRSHRRDPGRTRRPRGGASIRSFVTRHRCYPRSNRGPGGDPQGHRAGGSREIEFDRATGKLSDEDYAALKAKVFGAGAGVAQGRAGTHSRETLLPIRSRRWWRRASGPFAGRNPWSAPVRPSTRGRCDLLLELWRIRLGGGGRCVACGAALHPDGRFCESCGAAVAA